MLSHSDVAFHCSERGDYAAVTTTAHVRNDNGCRVSKHDKAPDEFSEEAVKGATLWQLA